MPTTPEQVVAALREALNVKAKIGLEQFSDVPYAVVAGPSGVATWVDLQASLAALPDTDATPVAIAIMNSERWDALDLDDLLGELCTKLGFCDAVYQKERLTSGDPLSIDAFVDAVIEAEGLDPTISEWRRRVRDIVANHFGSGPE